MAIVAQLVRASGCDSEGRGFEPLHSPQKKYIKQIVYFYLFFYYTKYIYLIFYI